MDSDDTRTIENPDDATWVASQREVVTHILIGFATRWREAAKQLALGQGTEGFPIGSPEESRELASLLATPADLLCDFGTDEKIVS